MQTPLGNLGADLSQLLNPMSEIQAAIQNCVHCNLICKQLIHHCLQKGGVYAEPSHVRLLEDCADICALTANLMLRESDLHRRMCDVCADACTACGNRCLCFPEDERMKACASACLQTASICQKIAATH